MTTKISRKIVKRTKRTREQIADVVVGGSQYDPGVYRLFYSLEFGYLDVVATGREVWALYYGVDGSNTRAMSYVPGGQGHVSVTESIRASDSLDPDDLDAIIPYAFDRIEVPITKGPNVHTTGRGGFSPTTPYLFDEGKYIVVQNSLAVGDLIVEHDSARTRRLYWFLYAANTPSTGIYKWPGKVNTDVTNTVKFESRFTANMDLDAFRRTLPSHQFLLGQESYVKSYPANTATRSLKP